MAGESEGTGLPPRRRARDRKSQAENVIILSDDEEVTIPPGTSAELVAWMKIQARFSRVTSDHADAMVDFEERMSSVEALLRPVALAWSRLLDAIACVFEALGNGLNAITSFPKFVFDTLTRKNPVAQIVFILALFVITLALIGVPVTGVNVNELFASTVGKCPTVETKTTP